MPWLRNASDGKVLHERVRRLFPERRRGTERGGDGVMSPRLRRPPVPASPISSLQAARNYLVERVLEEHTLQAIAEVSSAHRLRSRLRLRDVALFVKNR